MTIRKLVRITASVLSALFFVVLAFNIENLAVRLGWDNLLADAVAPERGRGTLLDALQHPLTVSVSLIGVGFAMGLWLDFLLAKRERAPNKEAREQLAEDAKAWAKKTGEIYAHYAERSRAEFMANSRNSREFLSKPNVAECSALEQYHKIHTEVWAVIEDAQHYIAIQRHDIFPLEHGVSSFSDILRMSQLLTKIAAWLRHGAAPKPLEWARHGVNLPTEQNEHQEPQGVGREIPL